MGGAFNKRPIHAEFFPFNRAALSHLSIAFELGFESGVFHFDFSAANVFAGRRSTRNDLARPGYASLALASLTC